MEEPQEHKTPKILKLKPKKVCKVYKNLDWVEWTGKINIWLEFEKKKQKI